MAGSAFVSVLDPHDMGALAREIPLPDPEGLLEALVTQPARVVAWFTKKAEEAWRASLREETIADLVAEFGAGVDPRNVDQATQWLLPRLRKSSAVER